LFLNIYLDVQRQGLDFINRLNSILVFIFVLG